MKAISIVSAVLFATLSFAGGGAMQDLAERSDKSVTFLDVAIGTGTPVVSRHLFKMLQRVLIVGDAYHVDSKEIFGKKFSIIYFFWLNLHRLSQALMRVSESMTRVQNIKVSMHIRVIRGS